MTSVAVEFSSACIVERTAKANEDIASRRRLSPIPFVSGKIAGPGTVSDIALTVGDCFRKSQNNQKKVKITLFRSSRDIVNIVICLTETYGFYYVEQITTASNLSSLPKFP